MKNRKKFRKLCLFGANGCIGNFLHQLLAPSFDEIVLIDTSYKHTLKNQYHLDLQLMPEDMKLAIFSEASHIIFAVATDIFMYLLKESIQFLKPGTVIIDTISTKCKAEEIYSNVLLGLEHFQILSIDPLFRPGISTKNKPISYFAMNTQHESFEFIKLLENAGYQLFESSAQEHDMVLSIVQVATHAIILMFGSTLINSEISLKKLSQYATPPFKIMMLLLHRILDGAAEVYWDIQKNNVFGNNIRSELRSTLDKLIKLIDHSEEDNFIKLLQKMNEGMEFMKYRSKLPTIFDEVNSILDGYL